MRRPVARFFNLREFLIIVLPALVLIGAGIWGMLQFAQPAPPKSLVITTATRGSPYYRFAERYAEIMQRQGIKLELRESEGSLANLTALRDGGAGVQAGFLQGGIASAQETPGLLSIGRLFHEPLWVFYRGPDTIERLSQLKGKRVLVGPKGGGTNNLALKLLGVSKVTADNTTLIDTLSLPQYIDAFKKGEADAGFLVLAPDARTVQTLLGMSEVRLMSFAQGEGLTRLYPFLTRVTLPQGVVDFEANNPPEDTHMLSTLAALVVRDDTHPALINLLAQAVIQTHGGAVQGAMAMFQKVGEFPQPLDPEFAFSADAASVYKDGPPFLQRYMPFWLANLLRRVALLLLPALTIAVPLMRVLPALYRWRVRRRILHWYGELKTLEQKMYAEPGADRVPTHLAEVDRIEDAVSVIPMPLAFSDQLYTLRSHIEIVRQRLTQRGMGAAVA